MSGGARGAGTALAAGALAVLLAACAGEQPKVVAAYGDPASTQLELSVDTCNGNPTATVVESDEQVRVRVDADDASGNGSDDCLDSVDVTLSRPLGTRTVIDEGSGETVKVDPPDG